jgi:polysaccharide biosynthesis protein PslG
MGNQMRRFGSVLAAVIFVCALAGMVKAGQDDGPATAVTGDSRDDLSPWGVASGAEWFSAYPVFNPRLKLAGVRWLRGFYEWQDLQPAPGYWNFAAADHLVENARQNGIHITAGFNYLARWASADGGTRRFPIKDMQFWRDYVSGLVLRYHRSIGYWEVWNEFDGGFAENGSPELYANLVREASISAKAIDPTAKIGLSVANFDVSFLDAAIKAGAAGHFDYICVHPYEKLNALEDDSEVNFLDMSTTLREMLKANNQSADTPLWITEIGTQTSSAPDAKADRRQAMLLAKAYLLSIAAGFERIFWFEARGPAYGQGRDFGLLRSDFSPRPSYAALQTLSTVLGSQPKRVGWLDLDGSYGFLFRTDSEIVLSAWAPRNRKNTVTFDADVQVTDLAGHKTVLKAGSALALTDEPQLIGGVPGALAERAIANQGKPYTWRRNIAGVTGVTERLQPLNQDNGVQQVRVGTTTAGTGLDGGWRRPDFSQTDSEGHYIYFAVDPSYVPFGTRKLEITAVVKRLAPDKLAGMSLNYESQKGYVDGGYLNVPEADGWQDIKWRVSDANFIGSWGWNFRLNAISSPNEFLIKEIRVRKLD